MKFTSSNYNVGYPVYGAKFLNDRMLLVAGGGGEGNNGIPNKLTVLRVNFEKSKVIKRFREITLDPNDDSPTTLDAANNLILLGCNENSEKIKSGQGNQHLRKFVYEQEHLKFVASVDFDGSTTPDDYTKLIYMSHDGSVGALASSKTPTVIRVVDPQTLDEKYEIETGHDVKDMHFAPDGKVISYITASTLEVISIVTGRFIIRKTDFDKNYILSKIRFLSDDTLLIAASLKTGNGIVLIKISLKSGSASVLKSKMITNKIKGLTSMDVDSKSQLAVLAGNDNSVSIVKLGDLSLGKTFKQVHSFAITRVTFSPDSKLVASVSAANTINVMRIPDNFATSTSVFRKICKLFLNFILIVVIAVLAQFAYKYDVGNKTYKFLKDQYLARRQKSNTIDILKQTTLVGDIVSQETITRPQTTVGNTAETVAFLTTDRSAKETASTDDVWLNQVLTSENYELEAAAGDAKSNKDVSSATSSKATPNSERTTFARDLKSSKTESVESTSIISSINDRKLEEQAGVNFSSETSWDTQNEVTDSSSAPLTSSATQSQLSRSSLTTSEIRSRTNFDKRDDSSSSSSSVAVEDSLSEVDNLTLDDKSSNLPTTGSERSYLTGEVSTESEQFATSSEQPRSYAPVSIVSDDGVSTQSYSKSAAESRDPIQTSLASGLEFVPSASKSESFSSASAEEQITESTAYSKQDVHIAKSGEITTTDLSTTQQDSKTYTKSEAPFTSVSSSQPLDEIEASNTVIGHSVIEEKTPAPSKKVASSDEIVTPTVSQASVQIANNTSQEIPSEFISLETGKHSDDLEFPSEQDSSASVAATIKDETDNDTSLNPVTSAEQSDYKFTKPATTSIGNLPLSHNKDSGAVTGLSSETTVETNSETSSSEETTSADISSATSTTASDVQGYSGLNLESLVSTKASITSSVTEPTVNSLAHDEL